MIALLLVLAPVLPQAGGPRRSPYPRRLYFPTPTQERFFRDEDQLEGAHYHVLDQRGGQSAAEYLAILEAASSRFEKVLGRRPKLGKRGRMRVELLATPEQREQRLHSLGIDPASASHPAHFDPGSRTLLLDHQEDPIWTRSYLLQGALRQFHFLTKKKNESLMNHWFVLGLAEVLAQHTWDGEHLEVGVRPLCGPYDLPEEALERLEKWSASSMRFTNDSLNEYPLAYAFTSFLMEGENGRHRERFDKLALGLRGSMFDGERLAQSLGKPEEVLERVTEWMRETQLPFQVQVGRFVDIGGSRLVGTDFRRGISLLTTRAPATRLSCELHLEEGARAGIILDYRDAGSYDMAVLGGPLLEPLAVRGANYDRLRGIERTRFREGPARLEVRRANGVANLYLDGEWLGQTLAEAERAGFVVTRGRARFERVEWE